MEIKQLEYFRAIVDAGTISGAARNLHMTQPPLSYQIKMLEKAFCTRCKKYYSYRSGKSVIHKSWKSAHNGRYYKKRSNQGK